MRSLFIYLPAAACVAMMLVICVPMLLGRRQNHSNDQSASQEEVAELRKEIIRIEAERGLEDKSEALDG